MSFRQNSSGYGFGPQNDMNNQPSFNFENNFNQNFQNEQNDENNEQSSNFNFDFNNNDIHDFFTGADTQENNNNNNSDNNNEFFQNSFNQAQYIPQNNQNEHFTENYQYFEQNNDFSDPFSNFPQQNAQNNRNNLNMGEYGFVQEAYPQSPIYDHTNGLQNQFHVDNQTQFNNQNFEQQFLQKDLNVSPTFSTSQTSPYHYSPHTP